MEKEVFLGVYGIRDKSMAAAMPGQSESGLWQAWYMPGGGCMVRAVDNEHRPQGNSYLIDEVEFHYLLSPVAPAPSEDEEKKPSRENVRSDAPDLLDIWYEQAVIEEGGQDEATARPHEGAVRVPNDERHDPGLSASAPGVKISPDERLFSPIWHPDELWDDSRESTVSAYSVANFSVEESRDGPDGMLPVTAGGDGRGVGSWQASPPDADFAVSGPAAENADTVMAADIWADSSLFETEALAYEQSMRSKFRELVEDMTDDPQPSLERETALLLERGAGFSWKQKFMFSEFGLILRRKRKYSLALTAHKRALSLAPEDENILFNVARAEYELGNVELAKSHLARALSISPEFASARTFMQFLNGDRRQ